MGTNIIGYKSDHWLLLDLDTGELVKSAHCFSSYQCFMSNMENQSKKRNILDLGMSEYHIMLWNFSTGDLKYAFRHA